MDTKKRILIISSPLDLHARAVAWALRQYGAESVYFDTSRQTPNPSVFYEATKKGTRYQISDIPKFDSVWSRRHFRRNVNDCVAESDRPFVRSEITIFERSILQLLETACETRWIDKPFKQHLAENKLLQLNVAKKYGIPIPETLVCANANTIRKFAQKHETVIVKPFVGHVWMEGGKPRYESFTAMIRSIDEIDTNSISVCPAIYQEAIQKFSDIRVVRIGNHLYATEYVVNKDVHKSVDVRVHIRLNDFFKVSHIELPSTLTASFIAMTNELNLSYSSADFVRDENGKLYFVDLNPVGQFIFNESYVPEEHLIDAMACHILGIKHSPLSGHLSWIDYAGTDDYKLLTKEVAFATGNAVWPESHWTNIEDAKSTPATM